MIWVEIVEHGNPGTIFRLINKDLKQPVQAIMEHDGVPVVNAGIIPPGGVKTVVLKIVVLPVPSGDPK